MLCNKTTMILAQAEMSKLRVQYQSTIILSGAYKITCKQSGQDEEEALLECVALMHRHMDLVYKYTEAALEAQQEFEERFKC